MSRPQKGTNQFVLLTARRFLPLFVTQFLGAFNDNFFKSALMMLITYRLGDAAGVDPRVMVNAAAGAFILPFFLFAAPASDLADRYDRSRLMRAVKLAEIVIMAGAALGFYLNNLWLLMVVLFLMGRSPPSSARRSTASCPSTWRRMSSLRATASSRWGHTSPF